MIKKQYLIIKPNLLMMSHLHKANFKGFSTQEKTYARPLSISKEMSSKREGVLLILMTYLIGLLSNLQLSVRMRVFRGLESVQNTTSLFDYPFLKLTLPVFFVLCNADMSAQRACNNTATTVLSLHFANPVFVSGSDDGNFDPGDVYRFPNVVTNVDALVTIDSFSGGVTLATLDRPAVNEGIDGYDAAFQPTLKINGGDPTAVDFTINFVEAGGTFANAVKINFYASALDIDGNDTSLKEFDALTLPDAYFKDIASVIEFTTIPPLLNGAPNILTTQPGTSTTPENAFTTYYENRSSINYRVGTKGMPGPEDRLKSLYFQNISYTSLVTTILTAPLICGMVSAGGVGLSGSTVNLTGPVNQTTTTDAFGNYSFIITPENTGNYIINQINLPNYLDISDVDGANDNIINTTLSFQSVDNKNYVDALNTDPIAALDTVSGIINQALQVLVLNNDNFGDNGPSSYAIALTQAATHGTAIVNDNGTPTNPTDDFINYTPNTNYVGKDTIAYRICDSNNDCDTALVIITVESPCNNILPNGGFEQVPTTFTFPTNFEGVPSKGVAGNSANNTFSTNWAASTNAGPQKIWLLNDTANVVNNPQGNKFAYVKGKYDCAQFCDFTQPNCDWANLLGETLINGMTYEISFYAASWNETISSSGAGIPTGVGAQGTTDIAIDIDLQSGTQLTSPLITLPSSSSFNSLNWNKYTYTFTYSALDPAVSIYISQGVGNGFFVDDVKLRKVFAASADQLLCNATSTSVSITPNVNVGLWYAASGSPAGAFFVSPNNGTTTVNSLVPGTYNFVKDINGCRDTVQVVNVAPASAGTGSATTVNITSTTTIGLDGLLTGEEAGGTWTRLTGTGGTFDAAFGTFVPTNATNSTFRYTKTGTSPCPSATADVTVNINNTPDAINDVVTTALIEDGANGTVNIVSNDTDPNGNPTIPTNGVGQFVVDMNPSWPGIESVYTNTEGVWTYNAATGVVTFDPANNFNGVATMQYELCDPMGLCDQASITFTVDAVNDAPTAGNQTNTTPESTLVSGSVTSLASDVDGNLNPNGFSIVTPATNGTFTLSPTGTYTYLPNANFTGVDSVTYQVCDLGTPALCGSAVVKINVTPICVGNALLNNTFETGVNNTTFPFAGGTAAITDAGGNSIDNWVKETGIGDNWRVNSTAALSGNNYIYLYTNHIAGAGDACMAQMGVPMKPNTTYEFCVHAADAKADGLASELDIEVQEMKTDGSNSVAFHAQSSTLPNNPNWINTALTTIPWKEYCYNFTTGASTQQAKIWVSASSFNGVDTSFIVFDDPCLHITNNPPVAVNDTPNVNEDGTLNSTVATNDTDADGNINPTGFTKLDNPLHGTITFNTDGSYSYTPTANFNGLDSIHYQVCDLGTPALCNTATLIITVNAVNDLPLANTEGVTVLEDAAATTINVLTNDNFGGEGPSTAAITITQQPANGVASVNNNGTPSNPTDDTVIFTPNANFNGSDNLIYRICDANGDCDTAIVFINVTSVNDAPIASNVPVTTPEDAPLTSTVVGSATDVDNNINPNGYSVTDAPTKGTIVMNSNGTFTYTPNSNFNGIDSVHYQVCDLGTPVLCSTATLIITVSPVNDKPVAGDDYIATPQATPYSGTVTSNDSDVDGNLDVNSYTKLDNPTNGIIVLNPNGSYTYTPNPSYFGTDSVHYKVCDLGTPSLCDTATLFLNVDFVNHNPIASNDVVTTPEDVVLVNSVATNVTDQDNNFNPTSFVTIDAPLHGTIVLNNDGSYTYTPTLNFNGVDSVHYQVCDYLSLCDTATIIVTITSVNDAPIAVNDTPNVNEDGILNSTVATNDTDVDGNINPTGFTKLDNPVNGVITFNTNGSYTYTPNPNFNGVDSVHYQVCDLGTPVLCSTATLIITVNSVNDLPVANTEGVTILEDAPATTINVLLNDNFGGDGASLTPITITKSPTHGVASVNNNGTPSNPTDDKVVYTPTANYNGKDTLIYRIEDANGDFDTAIVIITITPVNDKPLANVDGITILEDDPATTIDILLNDDFGGDGPIPSSITIIKFPVNGTANVDNNATANNPTDDKIIYTPDPNFNGKDSLIYRIGDANGDYDTAIVYINITPVNDLPTADTEGVTILEDAVTTTIDVITNDDFGGDGPSTTAITIIKAPVNGTASVNDATTPTDPTDDAIDYKPNVNFNGTDSLIYRICDANGDCDTAIVFITVSSVNDKPIAGDDYIATPQATDYSGVVTANDSDVDGNLDVNSYTKIDGPFNGTIVFNTNGSYTYTPNPLFSGTDSVHYKVCDLAGLCDTATIYLNVNFVNHNPIASNDVVTTPEDVVLVNSVATNVTDQDNNFNPTSFVTIDAPLHGTIVLNPDGSYTYTPTLNYNGVDSVHYQVCDYLGLCDTATIIVTITSVNDAPIASNVPVTTPEDVPLTSTVVGSSTDADNNINPNGYTVTDAPTKGTIVMNPNGTFTYTPNSNFNGLDSVHYQVCDLGTPVLCSTATLVITVTSVNDLPLANTEGVTILEDATATTISVLTNDDFGGDGSSATAITITDTPSNGVATVDNNGTPTNPTDDKIIYTPNLNFNGKDTLIYRICDANGDCDTAVVYINITPVNDIPTAVRDIISMNEDGTLVGTVAPNDFDVDGNLNPNSFTLATLPTRGSITLNPNGSYTYKPTVGYFGLDSVQYQVCDFSGLCDNEWLIITINHVNHAPVATNDVVNATEDTPLSNSVATNATDVDGDLNPTSFVATDLPKHGTIVINPNGTYTYTPNANFNGVDSVHYQVCDLSTPSLCDTATIIITVLPVNDAPVATNDVVTTPEDTPLSNSVATNATDVDGNLNSTSFVTTDLPKHGTIVMNPNGSYTYTPVLDFYGIDSVHYQVCDLGTPSLCDTATIVITVSPINDKPVATNDVVSTPEDVPLSNSVGSNVADVDNNVNPNGFVAIDAPVHGTIVLNPNGSYTYTPNTNFNGVDSVHYQICDLGTPTLCDTATIIITITPVNDAPVAGNDNFSTNEEVQVSGTVVLNDSDVDNNINNNSYAQVDAPKNGTLVVNPNGNFTYNPNINFFGIDTMSYQVCDLGTPVLCDTALIIVNVSNVNDVPRANVDEGTVLVNGTNNINILNNDTDADGVLTNVNTTITIDDAPNHGVASVNPDGTILYTPNTNYVGKDTLIYKLCDNGTPQYCDTAIVFITVTNTNNTPVANFDVVSLPEDTTGVKISVLTNDVDDQIFSASNLTITEAPKHGSTVINPDGTIGYKPDFNYYGSDTLVYQICDMGTPALCDTAIVYIFVTYVNDAPVAVNDNVTGNEDTVITGTVATNDTDIENKLNPNSFVTIDNPKHGTIVLNPNGSYTYTPSNNFNGVDSVHYQVCDTEGLCDTATLVITVLSVNDKPLAVDDATTTTMGNSIGSTVATNDFDVDGNLDPNSFVKIGDVLHGTITLNPNGSFSYLPTLGYVGKDSVQYQVCDLGTPSLCDSAWVVIDVTPVVIGNRPPVATDELVLTNVNTPANGTLTSKVSDPDGNLDNNSFVVVGTPKNGSITINANGSYIYTPSANYVGEDSVQYKVCDLGSPSLCDTAWILIVVDQPNRAPIALNDNVTTAMNNTYAGSLTSKVSDPDGNLNPNSFTQVTNAIHGSMTINANGTYTYTPTIGFVGKDSVQYSVCDNGTPSLCDSAWIVITILDAKPIAIDDAYTTSKNTTVGFKVTTNDNPKGTIASVNVITQPKNGSLNFVGIDSIRFTPFNGYCGTDTFTYSLCNQFGLCDTAQVVVTMNCVAQPIPPVAVDDFTSTIKNTPIQIQMLDNDTTNGSLTKIEVVTNPTRGTAVVQGNSIVYTPTTDLCGVDDVLTYRICNANGCDTAQITVSVNCGTINNNANKPVAVDDAYTTGKGISKTFKPTLNDTINGTLTGLNVITDPRHGTILFRSPDTLIYTPQLGYCGKDTLTYVILNNKGLSDTADVVITITCDPDIATALPVALNDVTTTPKNKSVTISVLTNDTLNGTLTKPIVIKTQPKRGTAVVSVNDIVYTPQTGQCGYNDTLTYEICNIQGCSTAQVIVTVACPATLPNAIDDNYVTDLNKSIKFSPLTNDNINGVLKSVNVVVTSKHGTVGIVGDSLTYNPATGYCGKDTIQYSITRDDNESDTAFIYVTINCGGARPDAIADMSTGVKNTPKTINVLVNDAINGTLTSPVKVIKQPKRGGTTVDASNNIIYTPIINACGYTDTLTYEICNANGCDTAEVLVTINCVALPDARNDVAVTSKNRTVDIDALTNDDINGTLDSFAIVTQPNRGSVTIVAGKLRYVPQTDSCGYNDTLTYKICNQNACDTASVIVTVTCDTVVKAAPIANYDFGKTPKNTPITLNVLTNDSLYSQVLDSIVITKQPNHGSIVITQTRQLFYAPNATFCGGNDTLIYKICTVAGCDTAFVVINVPCDTPALFPVANVDIDSTFRGKSIAIDVPFNDVLNGADTIRITRRPKHGTAAFDIDGYLIYQPDSIFCGGTDSLIYEICSLRGCDTALVLIQVKCDSTALLFPIAFDDSATTQIDSAIVITVLDNDTLRGAILQDSMASKPRHGNVLVNNGAIFYMPNPGYFGLDTFEYVICNVNGCDTAQVVVKIDRGQSLVIFNGFSPDNDGMNEFFVINGIEKYPNNEVIIWNRWGNQVGSFKGYDNVNKAWDGTWNGKLLPDGTYFYIINFNDGVTKPVAGYVQIHR